MKQLRTGSARPELVVDSAALRLYDPSTQTYVGRDAPFGRDRVVFALPLNGVDVQTMKVLHDSGGAFIADVDDNLIGRDRVWISRLLSAAPTTDTRRLR